MSIVIFAFFCCLLFSLGMAIAIFLEKTELLEVWSLSWLLGMGWGTIVWFLAYHLGGVSFSLLSLLISFFLATVITWILLLFMRREKLRQFLSNASYFVKIQKKTLNTKQKPVVVVAVIIIGLLFSFVFVEDIFWPVTDWDALALYDFRAKVMMETGSLTQGKELEYFFQYPLFTSMLHAATYLTGSGFAKIWYAIMYQAAVILFYSLLRKKSSVELSILGTIFLATSPLIFFHSLIAYTNLAYTMFGGLGFIYLWLWWDDGHSSHLLLGSMLVGLSTWIRISEPFYYVAGLLVIIGLFKQINQKRLSFKLLVSVLVGLFLIFKTRAIWDSLIVDIYGANLNTPLSTFSLIQNWNSVSLVKRVGEVIAYLWTYSTPVFGWYMLLGLGMLISDLRRRHFENLFPWFSIGSLVGIILLGTFLLSLWLESWNRIGDSVARMSMFLIPLLIFIIFSSPSWKFLGNKK